MINDTQHRPRRRHPHARRLPPLRNRKLHRDDASRGARLSQRRGHDAAQFGSRRRHRCLMLPVLRPHAGRRRGVPRHPDLRGRLPRVRRHRLARRIGHTNFLAYNIAMAGLGIGSLFFCVALYRSRLVPRFLAVWGFVGYRRSRPAASSNSAGSPVPASSRPFPVACGRSSSRSGSSRADSAQQRPSRSRLPHDRPGRRPACRTVAVLPPTPTLSPS